MVYLLFHIIDTYYDMIWYITHRMFIFCICSPFTCLPSYGGRYGSDRASCMHNVLRQRSKHTGEWDYIQWHMWYDIWCMMCEVRCICCAHLVAGGRPHWCTCTNFNFDLNLFKFRSKQQLEIGYLLYRGVHLPWVYVFIIYCWYMYVSLVITTINL